MMYGAIALSEGNAKEAELHLLSAENIISEVMGTDNDYAKTVYLYLNNRKRLVILRMDKIKQSLHNRMQVLQVFYSIWSCKTYALDSTLHRSICW